MTSEANNKSIGYREVAFVSGVFGLILFLSLALVPSLVYGGFAGASLAAALVGHPIDAGLLSRGLVIFGMVVGLLSTAAVFVVVSSAFGTGLFAATRAVLSRRPSTARKPAEAPATKGS
jgi:hypothetical protein